MNSITHRPPFGIFIPFHSKMMARDDLPRLNRALRDVGLMLAQAQAQAEGMDVSDYVQTLASGQVLAKKAAISPGPCMSFHSSSDVRIFTPGRKVTPAIRLFYPMKQ